MNERAEEPLELLASRNNSQAYQALKAMEEVSAESNCLYPRMDEFIAMTGSSNSYLRTRGLALIARNAKWDVDDKIDGIIDGYLEHITDDKPICARQCIKLPPCSPRPNLPLRPKSSPHSETPTSPAIQTACAPWFRKTSATACSR